MHATLLISTCLAEPSSALPSLSTLLLCALVVGFLMLAGSWLLNRSSSTTKASDRILTNQLDDKGVPLFFDLDTHDAGTGAAARTACRTRAPRR